MMTRDCDLRELADRLESLEEATRPTEVVVWTCRFFGAAEDATECDCFDDDDPIMGVDLDR